MHSAETRDPSAPQTKQGLPKGIQADSPEGQFSKDAAGEVSGCCVWPPAVFSTFLQTQSGAHLLLTTAETGEAYLNMQNHNPIHTAILVHKSSDESLVSFLTRKPIRVHTVHFPHALRKVHRIK